MKYEAQLKKEYQQKADLAKQIKDYYGQKTQELNLKPFSRIKSYLKESIHNISPLISRDVVFAHLDFEPFTTDIARGKEFTVISGLNPSSPLHLGHKVMFDLLLFLQKLGATIFIPITNDESYVDEKVTSLAESRRIAYETIIPSIMAFGFDPNKTKIFVMSDYPEIYNLAIHISKYVTNDYVRTVFGDEALDNSGKAFYRSAVQLAQILLPQLDEFGGNKRTLIPVGIDQHPYILCARDIAKKTGFTRPSELIFKFQGGLLNPFEKMSGSHPSTAIYLTDTPSAIAKKIQRSFTGAVSTLEGHKKFGGIPEACPVFQLLYFHHPDDFFVNDIYARYKAGTLSVKELKGIAIKFVTGLILNHQKKAATAVIEKESLLHQPLNSILGVRQKPFLTDFR